MSDPYAPAIAALEAEIATRQELLDRLKRHAEPDKQTWTAPTIVEIEKSKPRKRRGGRPPIDPADAERARKAAALQMALHAKAKREVLSESRMREICLSGMRKRRARLKAEAAGRIRAGRRRASGHASGARSAASAARAVFGQR